MEPEVDGRVQSLPYKIRSVSRESAAQKAVQVLDPDLRTHWSTSTNTKEWLVLELEESCLLSHIRIHNKSVLEWEISIGLRFKPDTYLKVRPRCEAPKRDVTYHVGYQPCCFVRISCLRGNPIAIFHIQLMGIPVPGLEPELQPVVDHVLPHVIAHIRDPHDIYIQLLQDIASLLSPFLSHLEVELTSGTDGMESSIRFFAMLVGPFYPIMKVVGGRENDKATTAGSEPEATKSNQPTVFTVSSNFQAPPKRVRSPGILQQPSGVGLALRPDAALVLLRAACKDNYLGNMCRKVGRLLRKLNGSSSSGEGSLTIGDSFTTGSVVGTGFEEGAGASAERVSDYSSIFGEDYRILDDDGVEISHAGILDLSAVEEGLLHVLYACAPQPIISRRLADSKSDLIPVLPLIQAMLPALRPPPSNTADVDHVDETFWQWQTPLAQRGLSQVVALSSSPSYRPLLDACAGYLSSYMLAHEKAACVLIDLCCGPLAPWLPMVVAKIDLAIELSGDLLGIIQAGHGVNAYGRAALIYLMLALSGHVDDVLAQYKDVKHHVLFLIEMLEPYLIPAITPMKSTIAFGDVSAVLDVKQEQSCALALDLLHTAIRKPAVLPTMEAEWKRGRVSPSVLLSILAPHVPQPPGIDARGNSGDRGTGPEPVPVEDRSGASRIDSLPNQGDEEVVSKGDLPTDGSSKVDVTEDPNLLFAPLELKNVTLPTVTSQFEGTTSDTQKLIGLAQKGDGKSADVSSTGGSKLVLDPANVEKYFYLQSEYLQLVNSQERELRALEFTRFATELHSRREMSLESHQAAIDALLLAAECHLNPFFMVPSSEYQEQVARLSTLLDEPFPTENPQSGRKGLSRTKDGLDNIFQLEEDRDKAVLSILLEAAEWDGNADKSSGEGGGGATESEENKERATNRVQIFEEDAQAEDALTLIREHQDLLCKFFVHQLQRERHNMYEVLLQGLLLILDSGTELSTPPAQIIDVILQCAERLNHSIVLYHKQVKEGSMPSEPAGVYGIRRQWALLRRLVLVGSGGRSIEEDHDRNIPQGSLLQTALIPAGAWMAKIEEFPLSAFPLVRYVAWMALARYANYYREAGLVLVSEVEQLTSLLTIFSDELYSVAGWKQRNTREDDVLMEAAYRVATTGSSTARDDDDGDYAADPGEVVKALYPELDLVFPGLRSQFSKFAENLLESVCELVKALPAASVPDLLSWFSEICRHPFPASVKGYAVANVKYVVLYLLEVIVVEHGEAIVPELPRLLDVVLSLCSSAYSDVPLLESVLAVLKPVISHATAKAASIEEYAQAHNPGVSFESLCFDAMLARLKAGPKATIPQQPQQQQQQAGETKSALVLFLAGSLLSDLSVARRNELIASCLQWSHFTAGNSTSTFYHYLRAFQKILEECGLLLERLSGELNGNVHDEKPGGGVRKPATQALFALTALSSSPRTPRQQQGIDSGLEYEESEVERSTVEEEGAAGSVETQDDPASSEAVTELTPEDEQASIDDSTASLDLDLRMSPVGSEEFKGRCSELVEALGPALEACWKIHPQLTSKIVRLAAKCLYYSGFRDPAAADQSVTSPEEKFERVPEDQQLESDGNGPSHPLEVLAKKVLALQEAHCWQVAAGIMNFLISLLGTSSPAQALSAICAVLQYQCSHAPRVTWRLEASRWLAKALPLTGMEALNSASDPLIGVLCVMLDHSEPEQRLGALQQLRKLITDELDWTADIGLDEMPSSGFLQEPKLKGLSQVLVASTWDKVATTAARDPLLGLRKEAMELLLKFVPFAKPNQLQSFLKASYTVLPTSTGSGVAVSPDPLTRLALMVLSRSCLYASEADVSLIPGRVWDVIELMADTKTGGVFAQPERALCQALLRLRERGEAAKESLKNVIAVNAEKPLCDSNFAPVRESVLEVLARLCAVWSKEDSSTSAAEDLAKEVEEAEIELELVSQERVLAKGVGVGSRHDQAVSDTPTVAPPGNVQVEHLMHLKSQALAEERNNMKAIIAARREKQRLARRDRHLAMEIASSREIELLQELDRERAAEAEREIERQRSLEKERAKTREMRHTLEMEAERRSQREYQRELEQRESGAVRSTRRGEFASSTTTPTSSRPRERYRERERESGRAVQEGSSRSSAGAGGGRESGVTPPATPTAAGGQGAGSSSTAAATIAPAAAGGTASNNNRSYNSGFAQAGRDQRDERGGGGGGGYEDSGTEGNGVSRGEAGDGNNFGDGDGGGGGGSGLEGGSSGAIASSGQRQGSSRSSRLPRQIVERRERDSRREGKWERKQT